MAEQRTIPIPLAPDDWAMLSGLFPTTPERWEQLIRTLDAMRPALVYAPPVNETESTDQISGE